ncbi:MAG: Hsp20/alpha crystallin family protein [Spirochaetales bacterium]|nr:Hsp20/alpha crystallin family protein [Spirochaetales bacterium]
MRYVVANKPVRTMSVMSELDRMMDSFFKDVPQWESRHPRVDIARDEEHYLLTAELPGVDEEQVEIKVEENLMTIATRAEIRKVESAGNEENGEDSGKEVMKEEENKGVKYLLKERSSAPFRRSFVLPKDVDTENIEASFHNGILSLTMKVAEKAKPRTITINQK